MILTGIVLNSGKHLIANSVIGLSTGFASGFLVGETAGFNVDETDTAPRGAISYTGPSQDIAVTRIADDTVRFVCSVPEGIGPITMGNLVLYIQDELNNSVPFVSVAFPFAVIKAKSADQVSQNGVLLPGTRFAISIEVKFTNQTSTVTIVILPPDYSSLPTYATEADVPPAGSSTFKQFVVNFDTRVGTPVMYAIDHNNVRWANPFYQQLRDPRFGQLDGGMDGEGWGGESDDITFAEFYTTPDSAYTTNPIGGATYTDSDTSLKTIGGATYLKTTNDNPYENI